MCGVFVTLGDFCGRLSGTVRHFPHTPRAISSTGFSFHIFEFGAVPAQKIVRRGFMLTARLRPEFSQTFRNHLTNLIVFQM